MRPGPWDLGKSFLAHPPGLVYFVSTSPAAAGEKCTACADTDLGTGCVVRDMKNGQHCNPDVLYHAY